MANDKIEKVVELKGDVSDLNSKLDQTSEKLNKLDDDNTKVIHSSRKFGDVSKDTADKVTKNGGAIAILDSITGGLATKFKDAYEATGLFNLSLKGTKTALIATGIGAFIVALGLVITYWDDITEAINKSDDAIKELNQSVTESLGLFRLLSDSLLTAFLFDGILDATVSLGVLRNEFSELDNAIKQLEKSGMDSKENIESLVNSYRDYLGVQQNIKNITEEIKRIEEENPDDAAVKIKNLEFKLSKLFEQKFKLSQLFKVEPEKTDTTKSGKSKAELEAEAEAARLKEFNKQVYLEEVEAKKKALQNIADVEKEFRNKQLTKQLSAEQIEIANTQSKYEELIRQAEKYGKSTATLKEAQESELTDIANRYEEERIAIKRERQQQEIENDQEKFQEDLERTDGNYAQLREVLKTRLQQLADDERLSEEQRKQFVQEVTDAKIRIRESELNALSSGLASVSQIFTQLSELSAKDAKKQKDLAIAATIIDVLATDLSIIRGMVSTIPGPVGIAAGIAASIANHISGFTTIKKIKSTKIPGVGDGGGGGASAPPPMPQFNIVGKSSNNQLAETISKKQNEPVKAYVVSSDVTTGQSLDRNRINNSTFL